MSKLKTTPNSADAKVFLDQVEDQQKRQDSYEILSMMQDITGEPAVMWGKSIIGFGSYHYRYESGREGDWMLTGFSPRKQQISLDIMNIICIGNRRRHFLSYQGEKRRQCRASSRLFNADRAKKGKSRPIASGVHNIFYTSCQGLAGSIHCWVSWGSTKPVSPVCILNGFQTSINRYYGP